MNGLTYKERKTEQIRPLCFSQVNLHCFQVNFEGISFDDTECYHPGYAKSTSQRSQINQLCNSLLRWCFLIHSRNPI